VGGGGGTREREREREREGGRERERDLLRVPAVVHAPAAVLAVADVALLALALDLVRDDFYIYTLSYILSLSYSVYYIYSTVCRYRTSISTHCRTLYLYDTVCTICIHCDVALLALALDRRRKALLPTPHYIHALPCTISIHSLLYLHTTYTLSV
jgi:hypothetical protein